MGLVGAQKVCLLDLSDGQASLGWVVIELAPDIVQVHDPGVLTMLGHLVDLLQPFHFTVTEERISPNEKLWQWT